MKTSIIEIGSNGVKWIELTGVDSGTGVEFNNDCYGLTVNDIVLDCDGMSCNESDLETIAVRNSI